MDLGIVAGLLTFAVIIEAVIDYIQTSEALAAGGVERNPVARWLQKKCGMIGALFIGVGVFLFFAAVFCRINIKYGAIYAGLVAAIEGANVISNFFLLKKMKLKFL
jgi:hypothetical protein